MTHKYSDKKALKSAFKRYFIKGSGNILSLKGLSADYIGQPRKPYICDAEAIRDDWKRVGRQLSDAANTFKK